LILLFFSSLWFRMSRSSVPPNWKPGISLTNSRLLLFCKNWKFGTLMTNTSRPAPNGGQMANLPLTDSRPSPKIVLQTP
jgi:hypothetical protein